MVCVVYATIIIKHLSVLYLFILRHVYKVFLSTGMYMHRVCGAYKRTSGSLELEL